MINSNNVYAQQVLAQGRDLSKKTAPVGEYPKTVYGRTFETHDEYLDALHEFMNGQWLNCHTGGCKTPFLMPYYKSQAKGAPIGF